MHRFRENIQSFLYVLLMILLFAMIGLLISGLTGLFMAIAFICMFSVVTPRVSPFLIFRRYRGRLLSPQDAPDLYRITGDLAERAGLEKVPHLFYLPVSVMNAFTVGNRREAAIGITEGLLRALNSRELTGVLAHEMSHVKHNDLWIMNLAENLSWFTRLFSLLGQWLLIFFLPFLLIGSSGVTITMAVGIGLLISAPYFSFRLKLALSRTRELKADAGAVQLAGDGLGLASALQKIQFRTQNLFDFFFIPGRRSQAPHEMQSHPDTEERIQRLLSIKEKEHRLILKREGNSKGQQGINRRRHS